VEKLLRSGKPFIMGVNGQSHVVVCYGAKFASSRAGRKELVAIHIFDPFPQVGQDTWLTKKDWPGHAKYRWEHSITVNWKPFHCVAHPNAMSQRIRLGQYRHRPIPGGTGLEQQWSLVSTIPPVCLVFRTVVRHPMSGQMFWFDSRFPIRGPIVRGRQYVASLPVGSNLPVVSNSLLFIEYKREYGEFIALQSVCSRWAGYSTSYRKKWLKALNGAIRISVSDLKKQCLDLLQMERDASADDGDTPSRKRRRRAQIDRLTIRSW